MENNKNDIIKEEKKPLGAKWWIALFGGILVGVIVFFGSTALVLMSSLDSHDSDVGKIDLDKNITAPKEVVYEDSKITLTFDGFDSQYGSTYINFKADNKTSGTLTLMNEYLKINGYAVETSMYEEISANSTADVVLSTSNNLNI